VKPTKTAVLLLLGVVFSARTASADAPPLSQAHADLDNSKKCVRCHEVWEGVEDKKCLSCHREIRDRINASKGYHAKQRKKCQDCHHEHKGRRGQLIVIPGSFNHDSTGYPLEGRHDRVKCKECHTQKRPDSKTGTTTYLFQRTPTCDKCHPDVHGFTKAGLGQRCDRCHNPSSWRTINTKVDFDHTRLTDYPLEGKHIPVKCGKCHKDRRKFTPVKHGDCNACHSDVHKGAFNDLRCRDCHSEDGFDVVKYKHNKSAFRLNGSHVRVKCLSCHKKNVWTGIPHDCEPCHSDRDPHGDQFPNRPCSKCHGNGSWTKLVFNHDKQSTFRLLGKHKTTPCGDCHPQQGKSLKFKDIDSTCSSCHKKDDPHEGQFDDKDCINCHKPNSWTDIIFDHTVTRFPLLGKHSDTMCDKCHPGGDTGAKQPMICAACHFDIHTGQFGKRDCVACHKYSSFQVDDYDHRRAAFPLEGKHRQLECKACHEGGRFRPIDNACADCHRDFHEGQFGKKPCEDCHTAKQWDNTADNFQHERDSIFPLRGTHRLLECEKCHFNNRFKPLDVRCEGCHIDIHKGDLGPDCGDCHNEVDWRVNAGIAHDFGRYRLEGAHDTLPCERCHPSQRKLGGLGAECVACHRDPHFSSFGPNCTDCHGQKEWIPTTFRHYDTSYRLTGEHRFVACQACHLNNIYGGLPTACEFCHLNQWMRVNQRPGLCNHANRHWGPGNCENCHTTRGWDRLRPGIAVPEDCR